jgi:hypothetical protein
MTLRECRRCHLRAAREPLSLPSRLERTEASGGNRHSQLEDLKRSDGDEHGDRRAQGKIRRCLERLPGCEAD